MNDYKTCKKCGQSFPLTTEFFYKNINCTRDGFVRTCKKCMRAAQRVPEEKRIRFPVRDGKQRCTYCKQWKPLTREFYSANQSKERGFGSVCKECETKRRQIPEDQKKHHIANRPGERRCPKCKAWFPLDKDHFYFGKSGYANYCIKCSREQLAERRRKLGLPIASRAEIKDGQKRCTRCGNWFPETTEYFRKTNDSPDGLMPICISCRKAMVNDWVARNPGAKERAYKRWYAAHGREYHRNWSKTNGHIADIRRRNRTNSLPKDFTRQDWKFALNYFDHRCAVCGRPIGLWHKLAADHWIPVAKNGPTIRTNIVPLCHGVNGCNNKKSDQLPADWLIAEFGRRKAKSILRKVEEYFKVVRNKSMTEG